MNPRDELTVWVGAARYYLGRTSAGVSLFTDALRAAWPTLSPDTLDILMRDIDAAFARDDRERQMTAAVGYFPLGHDCDRRSWETVRALWREA